MWVHEQARELKLSMLEWWEEPFHARIALLKKSAFVMGERERERSKHGVAMGAWSGSMEGQGQAHAMPRILAQRVETSGVCVYEKFTLRKLSMKA